MGRPGYGLPSWSAPRIGFALDGLSARHTLAIVLITLESESLPRATRFVRSRHGHDDRRDVVFAAAQVRGVDQLLDRRVSAFREDSRDLFRAKVAMQAIATNQKEVPELWLGNRRIYLDIIAAAHRARDDVALLADARLFG